MKINEALKRYIPIANLIAKTFGENCEVVIHDLSVPQNSVVYAVNNHVTGRKIGQSFDHLVKQVLLSRNFHEDYAANYMTVTKDSKEIKSSTALIRNTNGEVIGALYVNYDLEAMKDMKKFSDDFLHVEEEQIAYNVEPFDHVMEIVDDLIDKIVGNVNVDDLKRKDKISLIHFMDKKGIFLMKGSIEKVATKLNISKVTVYSYLDEIKKCLKL
ncbi:MAG: helix-turn-helix transcriptional regulator [Marinisporobacter sp.]|jgi:predicted transcriptional regulator YheO|nr:helix-turn-helix transcriptional regulator [Marinisporobacter sp.]